MRQNVFFTIVLVVSFAIGFIVYKFLLPEHIQKGGPLVVLLIVLSLLALTFIVERYLTLKRAQGKGNIHGFVRKFRTEVEAGRIEEAIAHCEKQGGSLANVLRAGLQSFQDATRFDLTTYERQDYTRRAIEEANSLEAPILERNLIALSTIASIATLVGLLGTTIGMIRCFQAMATTGAPDAIQLALGISEALVNTAGGLFVAIASIVAYNFFVNKVDSLNYTIDEAAHEMLDQVHATRGRQRAQA
jgi:biopolymer transport protein ExbB